RPFLQAEFAAGRIDWTPAEDEIRALVPMVQERLPTLGVIGDLVGFLFVREVPLDPAMLLPKRWGVETTLEGLIAARAVIADVGPVSFEADELEPPLRRLVDERGWKAG